MLDRDPSLASTIQNWLNNPGLSAEDLESPLEISLDIPAPETEKMQTEGEKLPGF